MRQLQIFLALVGATLLVAACSASGSTTPPKLPTHHAPRTDRVAGSLSIKGVNGIRLVPMKDFKQGHPCSTVDGYSDIRPGAEVVISDDAGRTLAITSLGRGRFNASLQCSFPFHARVPAGLGFYGVEVTHRGVVKEPESALGDVQLTLG